MKDLGVAATEPGSPHQSPLQRQRPPKTDSPERDAAANLHQRSKHHLGLEHQGQPAKEGAFPGRQAQQGEPSSNFETIRKRLGEEEHSAISQILTMQQEELNQQVEELHTIS